MLLEREMQLAALRRGVEAAQAGGGGVLAITGEAGAGKTTLVDAFVRTLAPDVRVLRGACENLSIPDPLAPLHDLAREAHWPLADVLAPAGTERLPVFSAALSAFGDTGLTTLIIIEDLHWADDATLDFARYLGRRIAGLPMLFVLTARDDASEALHRLGRVLADIPTRNLTRITVPPLSESAVAAMAAGAGQSSQEIYRTSAGNAFFVTELIQAGASQLPASIRDATAARSEKLAASGRAALDAASIFPRRVEAPILLAMLENEPEGIVECLDNGMLVHSDGAYAFRHDIARRAIETALQAPRRTALNAKALALLQAVGGISIARLAHHAAEAFDADAVRTLGLRAAVDASRIGSHREAADHYAAMLRLPHGFDDLERAQILSRYAIECYFVGRLPEAISTQHQARALYRKLDDKVLEGDALRWLSRLSSTNGQRRDADRFGDEAIALLETQPPGAELALAYSNRAQLSMLADCSARAIADGRDAIALGQVLARPDIISHALNNVGTARVWTDREAGLAELRQSLSLALTHNLQDDASRAYTNLGCSLVNTLDFAEARKVLVEGIAYCVDRDLDVCGVYNIGWLAFVLMTQGDWAEAAERASAVVTRRQISPMMRYPAITALALLRLRRADPGLDDLLAEMTRYVAANHELQRLAPYAAVLAERAWLGSGDIGAALAAIDTALALVTEPAMHPELRVWQKRLGIAPSVVDAAMLPAPYRAELAGDWAGAAAHWHQLGAPFEQAMSLAQGDEAAQRQALVLLDGLGAQAVSARLRASMRRQGIANVARGPQQSTRDNVMGLTRREMEILALVSEGLSSKRIAVALSIAPKTVDHHVAATLEKLGAHSRAQATALARTAGLLRG